MGRFLWQQLVSLASGDSNPSEKVVTVSDSGSNMKMLREPLLDKVKEVESFGSDTNNHDVSHSIAQSIAGMTMVRRKLARWSLRAFFVSRTRLLI